MTTLADRFWSKVIMGYGGECWEWAGSTDNHGYGTLFHSWNKGNQKVARAYRISWELHNGPIPAGLSVLHRCDNPGCVNPVHLFLGTQKDNIKDAFQKGRTARGSQLPQTKLTEDQVKEIRRLHGPKLGYRRLARMFNVAQMTISRIIRRIDWKHIVVWPLITSLSIGCARFEAYYPSDGKSVVVDDRGHPHYANRKALIMHGADSLGNTIVDISHNGIRFASAGGIDTSTSTAAGYRTARYAVGAAVTAALGISAINAASSAYGANQAQVASSNASAAKVGTANAAAKASASKLPQVGSTIPAQTQATVTVPTAPAPAVIPAAGSTIQSTIPATVVPVP